MATTNNNYQQYLMRITEREREITDRIKGKSDPLEAIPGIVENEGSTLKAVWESDFGYPFDGALLLIILTPLLLGVIGHHIASKWEPKTTGEELYDDSGNRIVEFPKVPIAYLQQTRKDLSATRENRNSLAWLCHRWLISTNDVVQELQAPIPLEKCTLRTVPEETGQARKIARRYEKLQSAAQEWRKQYKIQKKDNYQKQLNYRKSAKPIHTLPYKQIFRKAPKPEVIYLKRKILKARRLWKKLMEWLREYSKREEGESHLSDAYDSYWSSSETFSSDSGEHWKSYKEDVRKWAKLKATIAAGKVQRGKRIQENMLAEQGERRREIIAAKAAADAAAAAKESQQKSKSGAEVENAKPNSIMASKLKTEAKKVVSIITPVKTMQSKQKK